MNLNRYPSSPSPRLVRERLKVQVLTSALTTLLSHQRVLSIRQWAPPPSLFMPMGATCRALGVRGPTFAGATGTTKKPPLEGPVRLLHSSRLEHQLKLFDNFLGWSVDRPLCHSSFFHHLLSTLRDDGCLSGDSGRPSVPVLRREFFLCLLPLNAV